MRILITGFEPFEGVPHNPSQALLPLLPSGVGVAGVSTAVLPVDSESVHDALRDLYASGPDAVIHCGVAVDRGHPTVERRAKNRLAFTKPDNAGRRIVDRPVLEGGPEVLETRLPVNGILEAWRDAALPGEASEDAGAFLCNQTLYLALSWLPAKVPAGFLHLPPDERLAPDGPHLPLESQVRAVELAARAVVDRWPGHLG